MGLNMNVSSEFWMDVFRGGRPAYYRITAGIPPPPIVFQIVQASDLKDQKVPFEVFFLMPTWISKNVMLILTPLSQSSSEWLTCVL